ncbi:MAG: hypothetical protein KDA49_15655 [Rhodospirillaceae bacterium]|nr:hypothetical protein [Rhodospirillaceae bacterium]MCA8933911.1 hypothetical protein [Rhodospirillaceae bacterium]
MPSRISQAAILVGEVTTGRPEALPHPLTDIANRALIDHLLDRLWASGIERVLVAPAGPDGDLSDHLVGREDPRLLVRERDATQPLAALLAGWADGPVLAVSSQSLWLDGPTGVVARMAAQWRPEAMDALVLAVSVAKAFGGVGLGDLNLDPLGQVTVLTRGDLAPYYNTGVHIVNPAALGDARTLNGVLRGALARQRLYGLVHDGAWFHVGTETDLANTRAMLAEPEVRWVIS